MTEREFGGIVWLYRSRAYECVVVYRGELVIRVIYSMN